MEQEPVQLPKLTEVLPYFTPSKLIIDQLMVLPAHTPCWSIAMQETVEFPEDKVVRINRTTYTGSVFCKVQLVLQNIALAVHLTDDSDPRSYLDKNHSEIEVSESSLLPYVPLPNMWKGFANISFGPTV